MALPHLSPKRYRYAGIAGQDDLKAVDLHQSAVQNKAEPFAACRRGPPECQRCRHRKNEKCPYASEN
jgi:hypothetical protein